MVVDEITSRHDALEMFASVVVDNPVFAQDHARSPPAGRSRAATYAVQRARAAA
jgi:hypothetical protein